MREWLLGLSGFVLLVYAVLCAGLYAKQRTLMYFPQPLPAGAQIHTYESWRYAAQVRAPTLLVEAEHDEVIPRASTRRLLTRFKQGFARLQVVPNAGHNTISQSPQYLDLLHGDIP